MLALKYSKQDHLTTLDQTCSAKVDLKPPREKQGLSVFTQWRK